MGNLYKIGGSKDWHVKVRLGAYRHQKVRLCTDKATSATWATLLQNAVDRQNAGEPPIPEKLAGVPRRCLESLGLASRTAERRRQTWSQQVADYVGELRTAGRNRMYVYNAEKYLTEVGKTCGWDSLASVDRDRMVKFMSDRLGAEKRRGDKTKPISPKTVNNILDTVKAFVRWGVETKRIDADPLASVKKLKESDDERRRALTDDECRSLLATAGKHNLLYRTALGTGLRREELHLLEWRDVHLGEDGARPCLQLRAEATKARRADVLPLSPDLANRLASLRPQFCLPRSRVFPTVPDDKIWAADRGRAKIRHKDEEGRIAGFHSLRKTFITNLIKGGLPPRVIQELARVTDWKIIVKNYTDMKFFDLYGAVGSLPDYDSVPAEQARKSGTYDTPVQDQIRDQKTRGTVQTGSVACSVSANGHLKEATNSQGFTLIMPSRPKKNCIAPSRTRT